MSTVLVAAFATQWSDRRPPVPRSQRVSPPCLFGLFFLMLSVLCIGRDANRRLPHLTTLRTRE